MSAHSKNNLTILVGIVELHDLKRKAELLAKLVEAARATVAADDRADWETTAALEHLRAVLAEIEDARGQ